MKHSVVSLSIFTDDLINALNKRVLQFSKYMENELTVYSEKDNVKSRQQWMLEYKKWMDAREIDKAILEYLVDGMTENED